MRKVFATTFRIAGLLLVALAIAHCGDNDNNDNEGPGVTPTPTQTAPAQTPTAEPSVSTTVPTATPTPVENGACPSVVEVLGNAGAAEVLDTGWTGLAHDSTVVDRGKLTFSVTGCQGTTKPCGVCNISGPIANVNAADYTAETGTDINSRRCTGNTGTICTSNADCASVGGTCQFYFGSLLPLSAGGVSTCVINQITGAVSGTVNIETGASASTVKLISSVFSAPLTAQPCPKCAGDTTPNDGKRGGTCDSGTNAGQSCDVNGSSPNVHFGETSLDCPPLSGGLLAALPIDLANSTGTETKTLSDSSPNCRAPGFTSLKCFCDTCNNAEAQSCATNADCGGGICGGKRCQGGSNNGNACTTNAECDFPNGACTVPGQATATNACDDSTCVGGECSAGPFDQFCGPTATFQGCATDADCSQFAGNTCSIGEFRPCFTDNGASGASITATGQPGPFDASGVGNGKLAALFCIGPVASSAVNSAAGLPGLGRLELPARAKLDP